MKALVFDSRLELRDVPNPERRPGEALISVLYAGICGTDREILRGYSNFQGIPGHEFVGRVVDCDESSWIGKRVVGEINLACGHCYWCAKGLGRHCPTRTVLGIVNRPGVFAEYITLPVENLLEVPSEISDEAAAFTEPVAAACEILEQLTIVPGTPAAIIGDGRLGLLVAQVLIQAGAQVTLLGRHSWKMDLARQWGAKTLVVAEATLGPASFPLVVDTTGSPSGLTAALRLVAPRGTLVMKSTFHGDAKFDSAKLVVDEVTLLGSRCGRFAPALELLRRNKINVLPLISKIFPLDQGVQAFEFLDHSPALKVLLKMGG